MQPAVALRATTMLETIKAGDWSVAARAAAIALLAPVALMTLVLIVLGAGRTTSTWSIVRAAGAVVVMAFGGRLTLRADSYGFDSPSFETSLRFAPLLLAFAILAAFVLVLRRAKPDRDLPGTAARAGACLGIGTAILSFAATQDVELVSGSDSAFVQMSVAGIGAVVIATVVGGIVAAIALGAWDRAQLPDRVQAHSLGVRAAALAMALTLGAVGIVGGFVALGTVGRSASIGQVAGSVAALPNLVIPAAGVSMGAGLDVSGAGQINGGSESMSIGGDDGLDFEPTSFSVWHHDAPGWGVLALLIPALSMVAAGLWLFDRSVATSRSRDRWTFVIASATGWAAAALWTAISFSGSGRLDAGFIGASGGGSATVGLNPLYVAALAAAWALGGALAGQRVASDVKLQPAAAAIRRVIFRAGNVRRGSGVRAGAGVTTVVVPPVVTPPSIAAVVEAPTRAPVADTAVVEVPVVVAAPPERPIVLPEKLPSRCPACAAGLMPGAAFCDACGAPQAAAPANGSRVHDAR